MLGSVRRAGAVAGLLALAVVTALGGAATAAPSKSKSPSQAMADAAKGGSGGPGRLEVVAEELDNPRGIGFGPDGALYVAESGSGGTGPCVASPEDPTAQSCFGPTGAVTRITRHSQRRVLTGLPSVAEAGGVAATGPVDLGFSGRSGYLLLGNLLDPQTRASFGPGARRLGKLLKVDLRGIRSVADFPRFELANDPDESEGTGPGTEPGINSNPNGLLVRHRSQVVADAGGNDLLKVGRKGRISVVAVFPPRILTEPPDFPMQAVPTTVVKGPDGALYVGQLTGFPFPPGGANVFRVVPGKAPQVFARGFTNIIDIAFDKRGRLYVLEIATAGLLNTPPPQLPVGRLVRVEKDGRRTTLAREGLAAPGGFVLGHGAAYITNNSIASNDGEVVKVAI